jgi:UDP-N-acetylmuramate dehydrogenase
MISELRHLFASEGLSLKEGVTGRDVTTYGIGGILSAFFEPQEPTALARAITVCTREGIPYRVLGNGSNLLISDGGVTDALVIRLGKGFRTVSSPSEGHFVVGGAYALMTLSRELSERGFSGLEFAGGIPASLGGAVTMNAGAHGGEISSCLTSLRCIVPTGELVELAAQELQFSYRHSVLPPGAIIVEATLRLVAGDREQIVQRRTSCLAERKKRQPLTVPSAGSVFKNPSTTVSAGFLIEQAGLKGERIGGAEVSTMHANWIVNSTRQAHASDVQALIAQCKERVLLQAGIELKTEVISW